MGKRTLKYGGKSGILPRVRPIFRNNPIRPSTPEELAKESSIEQGYAENVPLPVKKGFKFERTMKPKPVVTVEERIRKTIDDRTPKTPINEETMSQEEVWKHKMAEIRREHLREAYLKEYERLKKIDELEQQKLQQAKLEEVNNEEYEESETTKLTLPTIESYLKGTIMRPRTELEQLVLEHKRTLNRKAQALAIKEEKATQLLQLYHQAGNFITTEEQLEKAITEAFEIKLNKFDLAHLVVRDKLNGSKDSNVTFSRNEDLILDTANGEINRKPGLNVVKDTIDGKIEQLKRQAELAIHNNHY